MITSLLLALSIRPVANGATLRDSLAAGEQATYSVAVPAQSAARIVVTQDGIDVKASLYPAGSDQPADSSDVANGTSGTEILVAPTSIAASAWTVRIEPALPSAERGDYEITVETIPDGDRARSLADAKRKLREGFAGRAAGDKASVTHAVADFDAAGVAAAKAGEPALQAEAIYQQALVLDLLGDTPATLDQLNRALEIMQKAGLRDREGRSLDRFGDLARKSGEISKAEAYFATALPIVREVHDRVAEADVLNNHGLLLSSTGRWDEAITLFEQAVPVAHATGSLDVESALHHNLGQAYARLGDYARSIQSYQRSLELKRRMNSPRRIARTLNNLANVYFHMGEQEQALRTIHEALDLWETSGDRQGKESSLTLLGRMSHAEGKDEHAIAAFQQSIPIAEAIDDHRGVAAALQSWASIDIDRGDAASALARLDRALPLQRDTLDRYGQAETLYLRALALQKLSRIDAALQSIKDSIDIVESLRGAIGRDELRSSYLSTVERYYDLQIGLLLQKTNDAAAAFAVSEHARARTLLDALAESAARIEKGTDRAVVDRERALQRELDAREMYRSRLRANDSRREAVDRDIARLIEQRNAAEERIRKESPSYAALTMPQPLTVEEVQDRVLDGATTLIEYKLAEPVSYAWIVDRKSVGVRTLPSNGTIEALARRYHKLLGGDRSALTAAQRQSLRKQIDTTGRRLSNAVLRPLLAHVRATRLLVIADGALQYIPFAALPIPGTSDPLITRYEIVYAPSASVLDTMRAHPRHSADRVAVFADPVFSRDDPRLHNSPEATASAGVTRAIAENGLFPRLRFSRAEAQAIAKAAGPLDQLEALDFRAAKKTLLSTDLSRYRIIHFATHGVLDSEHPELSGLVLSLVDPEGRSVDGFLRLSEIYNLDLNADLVVLSACKTALGKEVHGEGLIGLTRGFMYAGADRVLSSVWNVDDRASAVLMSRFYDAMLRHHIAPAAALRQAQLSMIAEARWRDPHDWAAFTIQGEWR